uniref:beta-N-acetylhexosaminidase n=1 Tax=Syphacia muris TaxID=451379 RepID=A0A0N5AMR2_9BILA
MQFLLLVTIAVSLIWNADSWYYGRPEPDASTQGGVWPLPYNITTGNVVYKVDPTKFSFTNDQAIKILETAFKRYKRLAFPGFNTATYSDEFEAATLDKLFVFVDKPPADDEYPSFNMDESYNLKVPNDGNGTAMIYANSVWGALRGLETFSQLIYQPDLNKYRINSTSVYDKPRFPHRGTLVDSNRHFLSVSILKQHLDLMAQNKMNVFHWHLMDSESFPYPSKIHPELSEKGAYSPRHKYTPEQVQDIIDYARNRGIRVVPEFDTPGHMGGWRKGNPGLLSECFDYSGNALLPNIFDPTKEENFKFMKEFFAEAHNTFKDSYMHFGGDEVSSAMLQC